MTTLSTAVEASGWARFTWQFAAASAALFLMGLGFLLAVDPYDSGRTGLLQRPGVPEQYPTTANASRGRDLGFDAAIVSNSRAQQLRPDRLDRLTGLSFVSLAMPGTGPADQLAVVRWFLASRARAEPPRAVVLGMDAPWCLPELKFTARFPAWLYDRSLIAYIAGLVRYRSFEAAAARLAFLRTGRGRARPDGYWDYAPMFEKMGLVDRDASRRSLAGAHSTFHANPGGSFPALEALGALLAEAAGGTTFVLLRPPVYETALPRPGTAEERTMIQCAATLARIVDGSSGVVTLDLLLPGAMAREPDNFYDSDHYRDKLAIEIEIEIAARLRDAHTTRGSPGLKP